MNDLKETSAVHRLDYKEPLIVFGYLIGLTIATVCIAYFGLGSFLSIISTLTIAGAKACLILMYFMHLKNEPRLFKFLLLIGLITLCMIIGIIFSDYAFR